MPQKGQATITLPNKDYAELRKRARQRSLSAPRYIHALLYPEEVTAYRGVDYLTKQETDEFIASKLEKFRDELLEEVNAMIEKEIRRHRS